MEMIPYSVIRFCAIEARLQMSGEQSVQWMVDAMTYADKHKENLPNVIDILEIGRLVEPTENLYGFRRCAVQIGHDILRDFEEIPRRIASLVDAIRDEGITPDQWFYEFERIHPFKDGNGRSGQVLFNWLNGTTHDPVWASNWFNDSRRTVGNGA